jgi:quinol monooxygenase YgiN
LEDGPRIDQSGNSYMLMGAPEEFQNTPSPAVSPRRRSGPTRGRTVYARSTTIEGHPGSLDDAVADVRDHLLPAALRADGCVGLSLLVDGVAGRCVLTTAWHTDDAFRAAEAELSPHHERVAALLGGRPEDEDWEIAVVHRDHPARPGACVRTVRVQADPEQAEHGVDLYRDVLLPRIEEFEGFCSASLLVDRRSGHAVSSVTFDSREAMRHTRNLAAVVREEGTHEASAEVLDVMEFELALAHLHVPELV